MTTKKLPRVASKASLSSVETAIRQVHYARNSIRRANLKQPEAFASLLSALEVLRDAERAGLAHQAELPADQAREAMMARMAAIRAMRAPAKAKPAPKAKKAPKAEAAAPAAAERPAPVAVLQVGEAERVAAAEAATPTPAPVPAAKAKKARKAKPTPAADVTPLPEIATEMGITPELLERMRIDKV